MLKKIKFLTMNFKTKIKRLIFKKKILYTKNLYFCKIKIVTIIEH